MGAPEKVNTATRSTAMIPYVEKEPLESFIFKQFLKSFDENKKKDFYNQFFKFKLKSEILDIKINDFKLENLLFPFKDS